MSETSNLVTFNKVQERIQGGMPERQAYLLYDLEQEAKRLDEKLVDDAQYLIEKLQRVIDHVTREGYGVNSLGELQGKGTQFDITCALRQKAHDTLQSIEDAIVRSSEPV